MHQACFSCGEKTRETIMGRIERAWRPAAAIPASQVSGPQASRSVRFSFPGHQLDLRTRELWRGAETVHLEPQVFDLLVFLLENRDKTVSKDELLDAIWDGRIVSEGALSSRIASARRAIGDSGDSQALIRTVHKR